MLMERERGFDTKHSQSTLCLSPSTTSPSSSWRKMYYNAGNGKLVDPGPSIPICFRLPDLVQKEILGFLPLPDIRNFRLVCRNFLTWVDGYSPYLQQRLSSIDIRLKDSQHIQSFTNSVHRLPFTRFNIHVDSQSFNRNSALHNLTKKHGASIHHLTISQMNFCTRDEEYNFYNSLTSIKSLEVGLMGHCAISGHKSLNLPLTQVSRHESSINLNVRLPETFVKTLESFKAQVCVNSFYAYDILAYCPRLKHIFIPKFTLGVPSTFLQSYNMFETTLLTTVLNHRRSQPFMEPIEIHLSLIDTHWSLETLDKPTGTRFLEAIGSPRVTLLNPNARLLDLIHVNQRDLTPLTLTRIRNSIKVLKGISPVVKQHELNHLEELHFIMTPTSGESNSCIVDNWSATFSSTCEPQWPNLRKITGEIVQNDNSKKDEISGMLSWLLDPKNPRTNVQELSFRLQFPSPLLTPQNFTTKFPNLQTLWLSCNGFTTPGEYTTLFILLGLQCKSLHTLELESSVLLDDATFMFHGSRDVIPCFRKLTNLKRFSLVQTATANPSLACGITDTVFCQLFSLLPLRKFVLKGHPLSQVTETALKALFMGNFGEHICEFDLQLPSGDDGGRKLMLSTLLLLAEMNSKERVDQEV